MTVTDTDTQSATVAAPALIEPTPGQLLRRRIFGHAGLIVGGAVLATIVLVAIFAPWLAPHDPYDQVLSRKLIPPVWYDNPKATWDHILGTDQLGRDYLSRAAANQPQQAVILKQVLSPGQAVPVRRPPALWRLEPRVRLSRVGGLLLRARAVARRELRHRVEHRRPPSARRPSGSRTGRRRRPRRRAPSGGAVEEVPRPEEPLLALDEQLALAGQHEERLLLRLGVVEAVRLARLERR